MLKTQNFRWWTVMDQFIPKKQRSPLIDGFYVHKVIPFAKRWKLLGEGKEPEFWEDQIKGKLRDKKGRQADIPIGSISGGHKSSDNWNTSQKGESGNGETKRGALTSRDKEHTMHPCKSQTMWYLQDTSQEKTYIVLVVFYVLSFLLCLSMFNNF